MNYTFPKRLRLLKSKNYRRVYDSGKKRGGQFVQIFYLPNDRNHTRFGISVGKRFGNAVRRNQLKRWIREAVRRNRELIDNSLDIIIHPKVKIEIAHSKLVETELQKFLVSLNSRKEIGIHQEGHPY